MNLITIALAMIPIINSPNANTYQYDDNFTKHIDIAMQTSQVVGWYASNDGDEQTFTLDLTLLGYIGYDDNFNYSFTIADITYDVACYNGDTLYDYARVQEHNVRVTYSAYEYDTINDYNGSFFQFNFDEYYWGVDFDTNLGGELGFYQQYNSPIYTWSSSNGTIIRLANHNYESIDGVIKRMLLSTQDNFTGIYQQGFEDGKNQGIETGKTQGYQQGYTAGYNAGVNVDSTAITIFNGILNIAFVPINFFLSIFNFEILGINLTAFVSAVLSICLVIIVIRFVTGHKTGGD